MNGHGLLAAALAALVAMACTSMSGLDSQSSFSCKAPAGVSCQSISGVYANSLEDNLPFQRRGVTESAQTSSSEPQRTLATKGAVESPTLTGDGKISPRDMDALSSGVPIRQAPLVLRVWVAPYEDEVGDLHDQSYFYTMVHSGKWMIEANRAQIGNQFRPVFPLRQKGASGDAREQVSGASGPRPAQLPVMPDTRRGDSSNDGASSVGGQD